MRRSAQGPKSRHAISEGDSIQAPTGGWNVRDAWSNMSKEDAILMDNWYPDTDNVKIRKGYVSYATGVGSGAVETLMNFASGLSQKMLAAGGGAIYDVSAPGAAASLATGFGSNRWQTVNFNNYLIMVNGTDNCQKFDGTTISANVITASGLASDADIIHINEFKSRLYLIEKGKLKFYYLPTSAIAGAAGVFDLSTVAKLGGYLMAMATWTRDSGNGVDDLAIFLTSEGEIIIYQGDNPGDADAWSLVGVFRSGAPVGRRCFVKVGSDLLVINQDGFIPLTSMLSLDRSDARKASVSGKIWRAVNLAVKQFGQNFGWQPMVYPGGNYSLFNVPVSQNSKAHQYVINTTTGSWCRFTGQNANCWGLFNDLLYFGGTDGTVFLADFGASDNGADIRGDLRTSFQYYGGKNREKKFNHIRPVFASDGIIPVSIDVQVDFNSSSPVYSTILSPGAGAFWDLAIWDVDEWGEDPQVVANWVGAGRLGYCASASIRVSTNTLQVALQSINWQFEVCGMAL